MEVMKANIAYKFELMPTREQTRIFAQAAGCRRFVWNKATELQKQRLEHNLPFLNYAELCEKLTCWKQEDDMLWLQDAPSQALQQGLKDECASINEFKSNKKGFPKFHPSRSTRKNCRSSKATLPQQQSPKKLAGWAKAAPFDKREPSRRCRQLKNQILTHYRRIRNIRQDFMKRTAHTIAQKYGWVAMENLKLKNMTKSAKGTVEDPGRNVKQKSGLNRSLARVAPYGMRMAILWALFKAGGRLILADPKYTSQTCPKCGYTSSSNRPTQAHFGCQLCGCTENADVVGALNVLKKSRTGSVRPSSELGNKSAAGTVLFFAS